MLPRNWENDEKFVLQDTLRDVIPAAFFQVKDKTKHSSLATVPAPAKDVIKNIINEWCRNTEHAIFDEVKMELLHIDEFDGAMKVKIVSFQSFFELYIFDEFAPHNPA